MNRLVFLGRTADRSRVFADIRLEHYTGKDRETVDHSHTADYWRLGISFYLYAPRFRESYAAGQVSPEERVIVDGKGADVTPADRRLIEQAWLDWHLNDMHAECMHMTELDPPAGAEVPTGWAGPDVSGWRIKNLICPKTGYGYGSAWLVAPLPDDVLANMQRVIGGAL